MKCLENYHNDKSRKDGKHPYCKACKALCDRKYRENNSAKIRAKDKEYSLKNSASKSQRAKAWYNNNNERARQARKTWYENNKDRVAHMRKKWKLAHIQQTKDYMNSYIKKLYHTNIDYKTRCILRARIRSCVRSKCDSTSEILGCPIFFFKQWIESQFTPNMNWNNMGKYWHLDHVTPCASFDLTINASIIKCFNWSNIRPLHALENMQKSDKLDIDLIETHTKLAWKFLMSDDVPKQR
jgi:hypothetical protein